MREASLLLETSYFLLDGDYRGRLDCTELYFQFIVCSDYIISQTKTYPLTQTHAKFALKDILRGWEIA